MIPQSSILRIARPTDHLTELTNMYVDGLGFSVLGSFKDHQGFDGVMLGHEHHAYHLEFTHHHGTRVGRAPTQDHLLVFYIPDSHAWKSACSQMTRAGFITVTAYNPYWDQLGRTFEDLDGYRVVLQNAGWPNN